VDVDYALVPVEQGTEVSVNAEIHLSGAIAQFGRTGLINEMSTRLIDEFVDCLHRKLDAETPEEAAAVEASPVHGISLFLASLVATVSGFVRRLFTRD
jgi:carbon-monoxide dehydrogenase small subunit